MVWDETKSDGASDSTGSLTAAEYNIFVGSFKSIWVANGSIQAVYGSFNGDLEVTGSVVSAYGSFEKIVIDSSDVNHDELTNFVSAEHIDWTDATNHLLTTGSLTAGSVVADYGSFEGSVVATSFHGDGTNLTNVSATAAPAGSNTTVQFNDAGAGSGDSNLVWDKTGSTLTVTGSVNVSETGSFNHVYVHGPFEVLSADSTPQTSGTAEILNPTGDGKLSIGTLNGGNSALIVLQGQNVDYNQIQAYNGGTKLWTVGNIAHSGLNIYMGASNDRVIGFDTSNNTTVYGSNTLVNGEIRVEGSLVATSAHFISEYDNGNSSSADTIDWNNGNNQKSTLTAGCTYTFTAPPYAARLQLKIIQGGTGNYTVTWPSLIKWAGATAPTLTTDVGGIDIITFWYDAGSYYGVVTGSFA